MLFTCADLARLHGCWLMKRSLYFTTSSCRRSGITNRPPCAVQTLHQWRAVEVQRAGAPPSILDSSCRVGGVER